MVSYKNMQASETQFLKPDTLVGAFDVRPGMLIGDFGCGSGYMSYAAARVVGPKGHVYAIDVQKPVLEQVKREAQAERITNISIVWSDLEIVGATKIAQDSLDAAFLVNMLFQVRDRLSVFREVFRLLKSGGKLLVVDWKNENATIGPPGGQRVDPEELIRIARSAGFSGESPIAAGQYHFGLVFIKQ